jgi:hypothetical protein
MEGGGRSPFAPHTTIPLAYCRTDPSPPQENRHDGPPYSLNRRAFLAALGAGSAAVAAAPLSAIAAPASGRAQPIVGSWFEFQHHVNLLSAEARKLRPKAQIMIAPYGTNLAGGDDECVRQLDAMDVDIVAYQDEVGVRKSKPTETAFFYERLRKAHNRAQKARIWADVEIFQFEGTSYNSALLPAGFDRVRQQLEAVSPFVDKILVYQYLGMMNKPGSQVFAGRPDSATLYTDYQNWRKAMRS